jgi:intracellular multiplication protein IcmQ
MPQNDFEQHVEFNRELLAILDELLAAGDWESSLFLKVASKRVKALRDEAQALLEQATTSQSSQESADTVREGYIKVYISLYQADGNDLKKWQNTLKGLALNNVGRPVYESEDHVKASIRARGNPSCEGYASVQIKTSDLMKMPDGRVPKDRYGNALLTVRENAVSLENIKEFVHANGQVYDFNDSQLTFRGASAAS